MKRKTLLKIIKCLLKIFTVYEFIGIENIPPHGGVIIALNHMSYIDTPLLLTNPIRNDLIGLVTTKYKTNKFVSWFADSAEGIWINRDAADFTAIRSASKALKKGLAVGIAPEGTRSKNGQLQKGRPGIIMLAVKTGAPIVPVGITGTESAFSDLKHFRRPKLSARFGKPFVISPFDQGNRSEDLKKWTHELMQRIALLLPDSYHGAYKNKYQ
jgi:1-acyl-sn-glycerol-3-phosphate acyltransferase